MAGRASKPARWVLSFHEVTIYDWTAFRRFGDTPWTEKYIISASGMGMRTGGRPDVHTCDRVWVWMAATSAGLGRSVAGKDCKM